MGCSYFSKHLKRHFDVLWKLLLFEKCFYILYAFQKKKKHEANIFFSISLIFLVFDIRKQFSKTRLDSFTNARSIYIIFQRAVTELAKFRLASSFTALDIFNKRRSISHLDKGRMPNINEPFSLWVINTWSGFSFQKIWRKKILGLSGTVYSNPSLTDGPHSCLCMASHLILQVIQNCWELTYHYRYRDWGEGTQFAGFFSSQPGPVEPWHIDLMLRLPKPPTEGRKQ